MSSIRNETACSYGNYEVCAYRTSSPHFINYCYLIIDQTTKKAMLIDPAWDRETLVDGLKKRDVTLTSIMVTHSHADHVHLVEPLAVEFHAQVYMSKAEIDYYHYRCTNLNDLQDMDQVELGETKITAWLTPGHTAGSMCYLLKGAMFTGDTAFIEGCGDCDQSGGSPEQMFMSIQRLKQLPSDTLVYPGHCFGRPPGQPLKQLLKENIYFLLSDKKHFVQFRTRKNQPGNHRFL